MKENKKTPREKQNILSILNIKDELNWESGRAYLLILLGSFVQALSLRLFLVPAKLASGGISGIAQIINHYTDFPIGLMVFIGNIPLFLLGWRYLGGPRFALRTAFAIVTFSLLTDLIVPFMPPEGLTGDLVLNSLYGGLTLGLGLGLVYRGQGTSGGSDILGRILNRWRGITISQAYLITDSLIILLAGLAFNWEHALYGLVMLYVSGLAAETTLEGSGVVRTAMIITSEPETVTDQILIQLERGVTLLPGLGGYTGSERPVLYCVISRSEVSQLKALVRDADPKAFMVIGQAHEALGEGFRSLEKET
jgi:uncharacterized membrane-anchored protein YitT (DUF2179 family)